MWAAQNLGGGMGEQGRSRAKSPPTHWRGSHGNLGGWSLWVVVLLLRFRVNIEFRRHFKRQATIYGQKTVSDGRNSCRLCPALLIMTPEPDPNFKKEKNQVHTVIRVRKLFFENPQQTAKIARKMIFDRSAKV